MHWKNPLIFTLASALPTLAAAQPGPGGWGHGLGFDPDRFEDRMDDRAEHLARLLDLTPEQQAAFARVRETGLAAARADMDRARLAADELRVLLDDERPDPAAVGAKVIELHQVRKRLRTARRNAAAELEKLLTPEQRFAFRALQEARDERFEDGRGFGRGPGFRGPGGPPPAAD
jgi:Spy/CpxP family protein refolding chaperone